MSQVYQRVFTLNPVSPLTSGGNLQLAEGQIGLFKNAAGANGAIAVSDITSEKRQTYFLEVGTNVEGDGAGMSAKNLRSTYFKASDVLDIQFNEAQEATQSKWYLGYDGVNSETLALRKGEAARISIQLRGEQLALYGYENGVYETSITLGETQEDFCADVCSTEGCKEMILDAVEHLRNIKIQSDIRIKDLVKIDPVFSCDDDLTAVSSAVYWELSVDDFGDSASLGMVQAQYPNYTIVRKAERQGLTSTYVAVVKDGSTPTAFTVWSRNLLTECGADCPSGYTKTDGGFLYNMSVEDNGADESSDIEGISLSSSATISVTKIGQSYGIGTYAVLSDAELTAADIAAIKAETSTINGDTVQFDENFQEVSDVCVKDSYDSVAWVEGDTCSIYEQQFSIILQDTDCGTSRLTELQEAYPDYTVYTIGAIASVSFDGGTAGDYQASQSFTGKSGTASKDGTGAVFSVTTDGDGIVTAVTVTTAGTGYREGETVTIAAADLGTSSEDLVITVASVTPQAADDSPCATRYYADVPTEIVCDSCHEALLVAEKPTRFGGVAWEQTVTTPEEGCLCGIYFEGKDKKLCTDRTWHDSSKVINDQIQILVSGGELINTPIGYVENNKKPFAKREVSRAFKGSNWGEQLWEMEKETILRELGFDAGDSFAERYYKGTTARLNPCEQYDIVTVKLKSKKSASAAKGGVTLPEYFRYVFPIEKGSITLFKSFFNGLGAANPDAGLI